MNFPTQSPPKVEDSSEEESSQMPSPFPQPPPISTVYPSYLNQSPQSTEIPQYVYPEGQDSSSSTGTSIEREPLLAQAEQPQISSEQADSNNVENDRTNSPPDFSQSSEVRPTNEPLQETTLTANDGTNPTDEENATELSDPDVDTEMNEWNPENDSDIPELLPTPEAIISPNGEGSNPSIEEEFAEAFKRVGPKNKRRRSRQFSSGNVRKRVRMRVRKGNKNFTEAPEEGETSTFPFVDYSEAETTTTTTESPTSSKPRRYRSTTTSAPEANTIPQTLTTGVSVVKNGPKPLIISDIHSGSTGLNPVTVEPQVEKPTSGAFTEKISTYFITPPTRISTTEPPKVNSSSSSEDSKTGESVIHIKSSPWDRTNIMKTDPPATSTDSSSNGYTFTVPTTTQEESSTLVTNTGSESSLQPPALENRAYTVDDQESTRENEYDNRGFMTPASPTQQSDDIPPTYSGNYERDESKSNVDPSEIQFNSQQNGYPESQFNEYEPTPAYPTGPQPEFSSGSHYDRNKDPFFNGNSFFKEASSAFQNSNGLNSPGIQGSFEPSNTNSQEPLPIFDQSGFRLGASTPRPNIYYPESPQGVGNQEGYPLNMNGVSNVDFNDYGKQTHYAPENFKGSPMDPQDEAVTNGYSYPSGPTSVTLGQGFGFQGNNEHSNSPELPSNVDYSGTPGSGPPQQYPGQLGGESHPEEGDPNALRGSNPSDHPVSHSYVNQGNSDGPPDTQGNSFGQNQQGFPQNYGQNQVRSPVGHMVATVEDVPAHDAQRHNGLQHHEGQHHEGQHHEGQHHEGQHHDGQHHEGQHHDVHHHNGPNQIDYHHDGQHQVVHHHHHELQHLDGNSHGGNDDNQRFPVFIAKSPGGSPPGRAPQFISAIGGRPPNYRHSNFLRSHVPYNGPPPPHGSHPSMPRYMPMPSLPSHRPHIMFSPTSPNHGPAGPNFHHQQGPPGRPPPDYRSPPPFVNIPPQSAFPQNTLPPSENQGLQGIPQNSPFAPQNNPFPPQNNPFSPQNNPFPPQNNPFPQQNSPFPQQNNPFPQQNNPFPQQNSPFPPHTHLMFDKPDYEPANPPLPPGHPLENHVETFGDSPSNDAGPPNVDSSPPANEFSKQPDIVIVDNSNGEVPSGQSSLNLNQPPQTGVPGDTESSPNPNPGYDIVSAYYDKPPPTVGYFANAESQDLKKRPTEDVKDNSIGNVPYQYTSSDGGGLDGGPYFHPSGPAPDEIENTEEGPNIFKGPFGGGNKPSHPHSGHLQPSETTEKNKTSVYSDTPYVLMFPQLVPEEAMVPSPPKMLTKEIPVVQASSLSSMTFTPEGKPALGPGLQTVPVHPRHQMYQVLAKAHYDKTLQKYMEAKNKPPSAIYTPYGVLVPMGPSASASTNRESFAKEGPEFSPFGHHGHKKHEEKHLINLLLGSNTPLGQYRLHKAAGFKHGRLTKHLDFKANVDPALDLLAEKLAIKLGAAKYLLSAPAKFGVHAFAKHHGHGHHGSYSEPVPAVAQLGQLKKKNEKGETQPSNTKLMLETLLAQSSTVQSKPEKNSTSSASSTSNTSNTTPDPDVKAQLKAILKERLREILEEGDSGPMMDKHVSTSRTGRMMANSHKGGFHGGPPSTYGKLVNYFSHPHHHNHNNAGGLLGTIRRLFSFGNNDFHERDSFKDEFGGFATSSKQSFVIANVSHPFETYNKGKNFNPLRPLSVGRTGPVSSQKTPLRETSSVANPASNSGTWKPEKKTKKQLEKWLDIILKSSDSSSKAADTLKSSKPPAAISLLSSSSFLKDIPNARQGKLLQQMDTSASSSSISAIKVIPPIKSKLTSSLTSHGEYIAKKFGENNSNSQSNSNAFFYSSWKPMISAFRSAFTYPSSKPANEIKSLASIM